MNKAFLTIILIIVTSPHLGCQKSLRPEEKAIQLVEESNAFEGGLPVRFSIDNWLKIKGNEVRPMGWVVTKKEGQNYLVAYKFKIFSFREGSGESGFFFEVNLVTQVVHNVTQREVREMSSLTPPLENDQDITKELLDKWENTEKKLSGGDP